MQPNATKSGQETRYEYNIYRYMNHLRNPWLLLAALLLLAGCDPDQKEDKYARPDWLAGKVYTQLKEQPDLSTFTLCVELTGYDTIIDRSGSYTVFAPSNEAFSSYFLDHPLYNSVEDIPLPELNEIVRYHIVQNPWTKVQLRTLDVYGWIDTLDINNNKPRGFKRQTLQLDDNKKLGVEYMRDENLKIVDTLESDWHRIVATDSRKYAPIFFSEYFGIYDLKSADYEFYFDRTIADPNDLYFAGGKIVGDEIFAENGFIYMIDEVVEPMLNAYQMLEEDSGGESYSEFLDLVNQFPRFQYNEDKTKDQPGADLGYQVDSLFNLTYPDLAFDLLNEKTTAPRGTYGLPSDVTIRYHHGLVAPTNAAFSQLISDYIEGPGRWGELESTPINIKKIIANTHLSANNIYPTDFTNGYYNGESDIVVLDEGTIIDKRYGSNCTFIGVNQAIVPRVFNSVAGPVYLRRGYSKTMFAIEEAGLLSALKREGEDYRFYIESNANCTEDSSLLSTVNQEGELRFTLWQKSGASKREYNLSNNDLRMLIMNHIGVGSPTGNPRKEFVKTLSGNFIIINNENGEVKGTANTTVGYKGSESKPNFPTQISTDADNGITYDIENWFSFSGISIYNSIETRFPEFHRQLRRAGLANVSERRYAFLSENENYTVFAPSDSAMSNIQADSMEIEELSEFLKFHFVQGDLIFTDGVKSPGYYETARRDERSTTYTTIFSELYIDPGIDVINIRKKDGGVYLGTEESPQSNIMSGRLVGSADAVFTNWIINGVIHEIDQVLLYDEVDTN